MKTRFHLSPTVISVLVACALAVGASAAEPKPARSLPPLAQFMEGSFILQTYGKPNEIRPMKQPDNRLKVEQWIYRRRAKENTVQTASNQTTIPAFIGNSGTGTPMIVDIPIPEYRLKHVVIYQVTALLMINDQLSNGTQWMEMDESYD